MLDKVLISAFKREKLFDLYQCTLSILIMQYRIPILAENDDGWQQLGIFWKALANESRVNDERAGTKSGQHRQSDAKDRGNNQRACLNGVRSQRKI